MDAAAGGAFLSLTIAQAIALVEKMVSNQERLQASKRGGLYASTQGGRHVVCQDGPAYEEAQRPSQ